MTMKHKKPKPNGSPCDIPPFCRNNYFTGKLLTQRDFTAEQQYTIDKLRLHHVALHGWGVVCGLKVTPHPEHPDVKLVVKPGLAIDGCGRQIMVPEAVERELPTLAPSPGRLAVPSTRQDRRRADSGEKAIDLYIYLRYAEREEEPTPAPFSEGIGGGNVKKPNRICESYEIEVAIDKPDCFERIKPEMDAGDKDYPGIYEGLLERSTDPSNIECIPLALIRGFIPGRALGPESIDNDTCRRWLLSTTSLHQLVPNILERMAGRKLTRIAEIGWTHCKRYSGHEFRESFIGEEGSSPGFEITFDGPVRSDGINESFQAIAVHYLKGSGGGGQAEVVPAKVRLSDDQTKAHLHIDGEYAENWLNRPQFDLYLLLRCNLVLDLRGLPVDGELLAKLDSDGEYVPAAFPTGDGLPGGLFETWIHVRNGETGHGETD